MDKLKLIKTIVFFITFLLVLGSISLLGILYQKTTKETSLSSKEINLHQDLGSEIASFQVEDGTLYLLVKGAKQADRIFIIRANQTNPDQIRLN